MIRGGTAPSSKSAERTRHRGPGTHEAPALLDRGACPYSRGFRRNPRTGKQNRRTQKGSALMAFTTRPEIVGSFGVVATTHWVGSQVGMAGLEKGGNAFDAAVAAGFVLHVVEPHMNGPGGDAVTMVRRAGETEPTVICGQGTAPAKATIAHYKGEGIDVIPGNGLLAAV